MYHFMNGLVKAVILGEYEQYNEKHVDMVGTGVVAGVMEMMEERNNLMERREGGEREEGRKRREGRGRGGRRREEERREGEGEGGGTPLFTALYIH